MNDRHHDRTYPLLKKPSRLAKADEEVRIIIDHPSSNNLITSSKKLDKEAAVYNLFYSQNVTNSFDKV